MFDVLVIGACFCSIQGGTYTAPCIFLLEFMSPTVACYPGSPIAYATVFSAYYSNASTAIYHIPLFESFHLIQPYLFRGSPQWFPWIFWDGGFQLLVRQFLWFIWLHHWVPYQNKPIFPLKISFLVVLWEPEPLLTPINLKFQDFIYWKKIFNIQQKHIILRDSTNLEQELGAKLNQSVNEFCTHLCLMF